MTQENSRLPLPPNLEIDLQSRAFEIALRLQRASAAADFATAQTDMTGRYGEEIRRRRAGQPPGDVLLEVLTNRAIGFRRGLLAPESVQ